MEPRTLALLTDFGTGDGYVAALKAVVLSGFPAASFVDISHEIEPADINGAAHVLADVHRFFPTGTVFLVVVDPGVGSARRLIAVEAEGRTYLGPDNGVLEPALALQGAECREIDRSDLWLQPTGAGSTFHGRDRLAPVAAALLAGELFERLGPAVDDPQRPVARPPSRQGLTGLGRIVRIDHFGNAITNLPGDWLPRDGAPFTLRVGTLLRIRRAVDHYEQIAPGEVAALVGSSGTIELAMRRESLARRHGLRRGTTVELTPGVTGLGGA